MRKPKPDQITGLCEVGNFHVMLVNKKITRIGCTRCGRMMDIAIVSASAAPGAIGFQLDWYLKHIGGRKCR